GGGRAGARVAAGDLAVDRRLRRAGGERRVRRVGVVEHAGGAGLPAGVAGADGIALAQELADHALGDRVVAPGDDVEVGARRGLRRPARRPRYATAHTPRRRRRAARAARGAGAWRGTIGRAGGQAQAGERAPRDLRGDSRAAFALFRRPPDRYARPMRASEER